MKNLSYTLWQIASWTSDDSEVLIPALQRGLVWKPRQVELLWDSILRGFPIGSFMLSDIDKNEGSGKYYLMDGQQRYNAISIGFNTVKNARAVLWIDLLPPSSKNSTRKFWIKATTNPHPWGFKNDDDANRLNASEKRDALNKFNLKGNIYNDHFSLTETWPVEANLPISLYCLLEAAEKCNDDNTFVSETLAIFNATDFSFRKLFNEKLKQSDFIALDYLRGTLFPAFKALKDYTITCNHLPKEVMEAETTENSDSQTTLEVLFTRLNTGGTAISRDDLNYSAIKAYWPSIKDTNDALAEKYMNPAKLVMLAFRLALTSDEDKGFKNEMSIKQIRNAARNPEEKEKIEALYKDNLLGHILDKVDEWLGVKENTELRTPSILRTIIALNSPDVYLLLMSLADKDSEASIDLPAQEIRALAFLLHWFGNDKKKCVQEIFNQCKKGINRQNILKSISRLMHDCQLLHIYTPTEVQQFFAIEETPNWRLWKSLSAPRRNFFDRTFWYGTAEAKQILLYAERQYINTHFCNYDPARQDMWAEENRPWDFDHIVPQEWIGNKRGDFREYNKSWLWSIGNIAAISFEANRSKGNSCDYSEYHKNEKSLYYLQDVESIDSYITRHQHQSVKFAQITYERYCMIYAEAYTVIQPLVEEVVLSDTLQKRKELILTITKYLPEAKAHFAAADDDDYWIEREQDWARQWVGVGIVKGDFMVCYEWYGVIEDNTIKGAEIGIRKAPNTKVSAENLRLLIGEKADSEVLNNWWYICEDNFQSLDVEVIVDKMKKYLAIINEKVKISL